MSLALSRRSFLAGLLAAPAIVGIDRLMPVRSVWSEAGLVRLVPLVPKGIVHPGWRFLTIAAAMDKATFGDTIYVPTGHVETMAGFDSV